MGRLTTLVLNVAHGVPAKNIKIKLYKIYGQQKEKIISVCTENDSRREKPLLEFRRFTQGEFKLIFSVGDCFLNLDWELVVPANLDQRVIRFNIAELQHYCAPLLVSPFGYSICRGN